MNKIYGVEKALRFYLKSNKVKTTLYNDDRSLADNIFGSIILAISLSSEGIINVSNKELIEAFLLIGVDTVANDYNITQELNKGNELENTLYNATNPNNKLYPYVQSIKILDIYLQRYYDSYKNGLMTYRGYRDASISLIKHTFTINNKKAEELLNFYQTNIKLKDKERSGWDSNHWNIQGRREKVSEHVVGTLLLAMALDSEFDYNFNLESLLTTLSLHEIGEATIGDITPFDGISREEKELREHIAMSNNLGNLKEKDYLLKLLFEFDKQEKRKMKVAHMIDKIECDIQSKIYQDNNQHNALNNQRNNVVMNSSKVQDMIKNGAKTPFDIWYEWDKEIYMFESEFREFFMMLNYVYYNNTKDIEKGYLKQEEKTLTRKK